MEVKLLGEHEEESI
jgi:hypothetical protein